MSKDRHVRRREVAKLDFLNRDSEIKALGDFFAEGYQNVGHLQVIELFGVGGIGKTTLIEQTIKRAPIEIEDNLWVRISLEGERTHGPVAPLACISDSVPFDCYRFAAARLAIFLKEGRRVPKGSTSYYYNSIDVLFDLLGLPKIIEYGAGLINKIRRSLEKCKGNIGSEVGYLFDSATKIMEIEDKLGHFLGLDVREYVEQKQESCFFIYECYEHQTTATKRKGALWLQDFISAVHRGVHVIATREHMGWDHTWDEHLISIPLGQLADDVCAAALRKTLPNLSDPDMAYLVDAIGGLPFYLEIASALGDPAEAMALIRSAGTLSDQRSVLVRRFLEGMDENTAAMIKDLGLVQYFDSSTFLGIQRRLGISIPSVDFEAVVRLSVVEEVPVEGQKDLYKTHDLFSRHVRQDTNEAAALRVACGTLDSLEVTGVGRQAAALVYLGILAALDGVERLPPPLTDQLLEGGYRLYVMGAWRTLAQAPTVLSEQGQRRLVGCLARFFEAMSRRKMERIASALSIMNGLWKEAAGSLELEGAIRVETAYLKEIGGDYYGAREELTYAFERLGSFHPHKQRHVRTVLYYADILAMFGQLEESASCLAEHATMLQDADNWADWVEYERHRGHCYRFSFLHREACAIYAGALDHAAGCEALEAKLITNLAESLCWLAPEKGLEVGQKALLLNRNLDAPIEIGKALAARSVALAGLGYAEEAWSDCEESAHVSRESDYVAGQLFAALAACRIAAAQGGARTLECCITQLEGLVSRLGVYDIVRVPAYVMAGRLKEAHVVAKQLRPLDAPEFVKRVQKVLG